MPTVSRTFILTGLVYLAGAMLLGVALASGVSWVQGGGGLYPVYIHLLVVGWITQLIFGVAYWMFPARRRDPGRGERVTLWSCYALLNLGLLARAIAEPRTAGAQNVWSVLLVASAVAQVIAVALFVAHIWPRVSTR